jgi:hypothetical protein
MSRKSSKKPTPDPAPTVIVANNLKAAIGQFESAILLWFNEADPISILVLASNAHDCYHALGKKIGKPSFHAEFMETMPQSVRERSKYIQDFAKHGFKDLEENADFDTVFAEALMAVCLHCHFEIFGNMTLLMSLLTSRMCSEHPEWMGTAKLPKAIRDSALIDDAAKGSRRECLERYLPALRLAGAHVARPL